MNSPLAQESRGNLTILRLALPAKRNALTTGMKAGLEEAIARYFREPAARCLIITGSDGAFCAGGDLAGLEAGHSPAQTRWRMEGSHRWAKLLMTGEKPVITAINGVAAGAGFGLALLGDIVLAAEGAAFIPGFGAVGVAPDMALAMTLPRAVGMIRAKDILLANRRVDADEAQRIGLVSRVVPAAELMPTAIELGESLAQGPTLAFGLTKRLLNTSACSLDAFLAAEVAAQTEAFASHDCAEGVRAFHAKGSPVFRGS